MLLPTSTSSSSTDYLCPSRLVPRSFTSDVTSTAKSFKSWDTCMDNKTCKIIAIVGIVLAVIVGIWIVGGLIRCLCFGLRGIGELFCCCFPNKNRQVDNAPAYYAGANAQASAHNNPYMYPPKPQQAYDTTNWNREYTSVSQHQNQQQFTYGPGVVSDEPEKYDYNNNSYNNYNNNSNNNTNGYSYDNYTSNDNHNNYSSNNPYRGYK